MPIEESEKQKVATAVREIQAELGALSLPFPEKVLVIKTVGNEEGGAAYTRANAIVLPRSELSGPVAKLPQLISHELFHVLSRKNPALRDKLYAAIGFVPCKELAFPPELAARKITNPDASVNDHCIRVQDEGKPVWAMPILFSSAKAYDIARGGEFFDYLQFRLLLVNRLDGGSAASLVYDVRNPRLLEVMQVSGFTEQVGKNTDYIIHPEEILADNFALLVLQKRGVPSPEIIKKMETILRENRPAAPGSAK